MLLSSQKKTLQLPTEVGRRKKRARVCTLMKAGLEQEAMGEDFQATWHVLVTGHEMKSDQV